MRARCVHTAETHLDAKTTGAIDPRQMRERDYVCGCVRERERGNERGRGNVWTGVIVDETECCHTSTPAASPPLINTIFVVC